MELTFLYSKVMEEEIWKPIKGYEGLYEVSNLGRIKSLIRNGSILNPIQKKRTNTYTEVVELYRKGRKRFTVTVYQLVIQAFVGGKHRVIIHKDGNPSNNSLNNLKYFDTIECTKCGSIIPISKKSGYVCSTKLCTSCKPEKSNKNYFIKYDKEKNRNKARKACKNLNYSYIKNNLKKQGFSSDNITLELIETKRILIKIKRLCKTLEN